MKQPKSVPSEPVIEPLVEPAPTPQTNAEPEVPDYWGIGGRYRITDDGKRVPFPEEE